MPRFSPRANPGNTFEKYPEIERIVSSPESCALMKDMTKLKLPALEALHHVDDFTALAWHVKHFDSDNFDNFKKMVGSLVKDVMCELGFEEVDPGRTVPTKISPIFENGAKYQPRTPES